jgi:phosphoribosylaminoimidazolecarboxamide formyltransferase/IMP cyclohydrolase
MKSIQSALISVFHKDGLAPIVKKLHEEGVKLYSTGGTQKFIEEQGVPVTAVESLTDYPSILGGRVKTLHPKVFGGILGRRDEAGDKAEMTEYGIPEIDMVIVDLYPFEKTVRTGKSEQEIIEKIDIGGISLIRAAAKNFKDTWVVSAMDQYNEVIELLNEHGAQSDMETRKRFAAYAFGISSHYDSAIFNWYNSDLGLLEFKVSHLQGRTLRYGENPHQKGFFYGPLNEVFDQLHGKEMSYNNLVDIDAAVHLISEFKDTTFAILKHTNPCGVATRDNLKQAYLDALACDNVSAFGGILIANRAIDADTAEEIHKLFCEVVIAPDYESAALEILKDKKNRIILKQKRFEFAPQQFRSLLDGLLAQDQDKAMEFRGGFNTATKRSATDAELNDLEFALKCVKHLKSNTIVLAKGNQMIGMGCGQTSRVDALRQAIEKARSFGFDPKGAVMASDAFFPFPDCVEIADSVGVTAVVQPGGSIKDQDSIDYCDAHDMAMVMTGVRHFKH